MSRLFLVACLSFATGCHRAPCEGCEDAGETEDAACACADDAGPDPECVGRTPGEACSGGRICTDGTCAASRCGDGYVDEAREEQCDREAGCDALCHLLPCPPRTCADGTRDASGECVYHAAREGEACEDLDACTDDDVCTAGVCVGSEITQQASLRSVLTSFGAEPVSKWMEGTASFVEDDMIVFLDSPTMTRGQLSLVRVDATGLTRLSSAQTKVAYSYATRSVIYWGQEDTTFIVKMGAHRFAVVGGEPFSSSGIELFDYENDELTALGYTELPLTDGSPDSKSLKFRGAAGRDDVLFACGESSFGRRLRSYVLDPLTGTFTTLTDIAVPSGGCNELALSPDGTRLYLAANGGYRIYDVTDPATFAVPSSGPHVVLVASRYLEDIEVSADRVVVLTARDAGDFDDVLVFGTDGTALGAVGRPSAGNATPFGIAVSGARLLVEWARSGAPLFVAVHALDEAGVPSRAEWPLRSSEFPATTVAPIARGDLFVTRPWQHVLRHDAHTASLTPLTGPEQGSMRAVLARSANEIVAFGGLSRHRIDVSDHDAPHVISGGMHLPTTSRGFLFAVPALGATARLFEPVPDAYYPLGRTETQQPFTLLDASPETPAVLGEGYFEGPVRGAGLAFASGKLYQVTLSGIDYRIERFETASTIGQRGGAWTPDRTGLVPGVVLPDYPLAGMRSLGVSESGEDILIAGTRGTNETASRTTLVLVWVKFTEAGFTKVAEGAFNETVVPWPSDIFVSGNDAWLVGSTSIARMRLDGSTIVRERHRTVVAGDVGYYIRFLHADRNSLVVAHHGWHDPGEGVRRTHIWDAMLFDATELTELASYRTPDEPRSMLVHDTSFIFGMSTGIAIVAPSCGASP